MIALKSHVARIFRGETQQPIDPAVLRPLLDDMRNANMQPRQLEELGRWVLSQVSDQLKARIHTEKAMHQARGPGHE